MLPAESHGYRARSILHMLYETDAWLEQHAVPAAWPANNRRRPPQGRKATRPSRP